jgi:probable selenium-dependent hydroxylase accessory protein YqeC
VEPSRRLSDAIGISRGDLVAFVGAGGKTGAILTLVRELSDAGWKVLASTTTKVGDHMGSTMPLVMAGAGEAAGEDRSTELRVGETLRANQRALLVAGETTDHKLSGVSPALLAQLRSRSIADAILVEADGARQRSLKLPDEHEPVVPDGADVMVPVAGLDVLGRVIGESTAHRHRLVEAYARADRITVDLITSILTDESAGLKGLPALARCVPMLTRAREAPSGQALEIASGILSRRPDRIDHVVIADLRSDSFSVVRCDAS